MRELDCSFQGQAAVSSAQYSLTPLLINGVNQLPYQQDYFNPNSKL